MSLARFLAQIKQQASEELPKHPHSEQQQFVQALTNHLDSLLKNSDDKDKKASPAISKKRKEPSITEATTNSSSSSASIANSTKQQHSDQSGVAPSPKRRRPTAVAKLPVLMFSTPEADTEMTNEPASKPIKLQAAKLSKQSSLYSRRTSAEKTDDSNDPIEQFHDPESKKSPPPQKNSPQLFSSHTPITPPPSSPSSTGELNSQELLHLHRGQSLSQT